MMTLINGKFYVDGKEVPVEIGNREQIRLLKEKQGLIESGVKIDVETDEVTTYTIEAKFRCPSCDTNNFIHEDSEYPFNNSDIRDILILDSTCRGCGQDFELEAKNGEYIFKMI